MLASLRSKGARPWQTSLAEISVFLGMVAAMAATHNTKKPGSMK